MFKFIATGVALLTLSQNSQSLKNNDCSEIIPKRVTASEFIDPTTQSYSKIKSIVINQALADAVRQISGTEVREFSSLNLSSINGDESEKFNDSATTKTKGKIESYKVVSEEIINMGAGKILEVVVDANICIQDKSSMKNILLIGDFTYKNQSWPQFRSAIKSVFSQQSSSFELGYGHPNSAYHDIAITGKIDQISQDKKVDRKAMEDAQGAAMFQSILGAMNKGKGNNNPFGNIFNSVQNNTATLNRVHVKVYVSVSANHKTDNRNYTASAMSEKEVSEDSVRSIVDSLAFDATKKASKDLYIKLNIGSNENEINIMDLLDY